MDRGLVSNYAEQIRGVSYKPNDLHDGLDKDSVILLRANNIDDGKINFDDVVYVDRKKVSKSQYLQKGDILICASSGSKNLVGKAASVDFGTECTFGAFCKVVRPTKVTPEFLGLFFQSPSYRRKISALAQGANINNIKNEHIDNLQLAIYSEREQRQIIERLTRVITIIHARKDELSKLDELIKARFVELFGNGRDGKCNSVFMGDCCKFQQGTQIPVELQEEEYKEGYKRFLRIIDYTQAPQPPRYVCVDGREIDVKSVVIVRYGATAGFVGRGYSGILANNLFEVVPDESVISKDFLYLALKYGTFERDIHEKAFGAAMPALSFSMMKDIPLVAPALIAQEEFVSFFEQVDKSKVVVQKALDEAQLLFDSLMQEYFG